MVYSSLLSSVQDDLDKFEASWTMKLNNSDIDLYKALELAGKLFHSSNLRAQHYKTLFNLYFTPAKLYDLGKREDDKCPRCLEGPANLIHMFHQCDKLSLIR